MKTEVLMRRPLFDGEIRQKSLNGFLCKNDIMAVGNRWRLLNQLKPLDYNSWLRTESTQEFIKALEMQFGKSIEATRGREGLTWLHPYLFIDLALAISPKLKIEVYSWLYDELLKYRNFSGDSYKKMCGALFVNTNSKTTFARDITKLAEYIKNQIGVKDWQTATEEQLRLRDKLHENIALLSEVLKDNNQAIRIATFKTLGK